MTIICYKDGVMAADSAVWAGSLHVGTMQKLARSIDGAITGVCGLGSYCQQWLKWFELTEDASARNGFIDLDEPIRLLEDEDFAAIWVEPDKTIWKMFGRERVPYQLSTECAALGCGEDIGYALMYAANMSAQSAVEKVIELVDRTGGPVKYIGLGDTDV